MSRRVRFKDLEVGQRFTRIEWQYGAVSAKIKPYKKWNKNREKFFWVTAQDKETGIPNGRTKPDDWVVPVD